MTVPTSVSLLERLKHSPPDSADWRRLHDLYAPLIRYWLGKDPKLRDEADDLSQDVMLAVVRELPRFERRRDGSFRTWLRVITVNRLRAHWRTRRHRPHPGTDDFLEQLADPASELSRQWDEEHDRRVFQKLFEIMEAEFRAETLLAFREFFLEDRPVTEVAADLGVSVNQVYLAKSRVLKRLREEAHGLLY
jgi:RNA polymerase sigma-70 factor (ECF subfamily)